VRSQQTGHVFYRRSADGERNLDEDRPIGTIDIEKTAIPHHFLFGTTAYRGKAIRRRDVDGLDHRIVHGAACADSDR